MTKNFTHRNFFKFAHTDQKLSYNNEHHYAIQITASQFVGEPCDPSRSVAHSSGIFSYITLHFRNSRR